MSMSNRNAKPFDKLNSNDRLSKRLDLTSGAKISPINIAVLEEIARLGSISAASRALRVSYRRTWDLVEELNHSLGYAAR
jgi:molybdate transport system regulatory protein